MVTTQKGIKTGRPYQLIAALLSGRQLLRSDVARELGVKLAAADQHLKQIEAASIPGIVFEKRKNKKYVRWQGEGSNRAVTRPLATAACFAAAMAQVFRGTAYEPRFHDLRDDLVKHLKKRDDFAEARRKFLLVLRGGGEVALKERQELLDELVEAVLSQKMVELNYSSFEGKKRVVEVTPYSIAVYDHQLYLIGTEDGRDVRPYRMSRIHHLKVLRKSFSYPNRTIYDPDVLFRDRFGIFLYNERSVEDVHLRFSPRWRTFAKTHLWHPTHQVVSDEREGVTVRLRVRICEELRSFILGFGEAVEVVDPLSLRKEIAARAKKLANVYPNNASPTKTATGNQSSSRSSKSDLSRGTKPKQKVSPKRERRTKQHAAVPRPKRSSV